VSRLPTLGSDDGTWGTVLNDYLSLQHQGDGTHKYDSIIPSGLDSAKPPALAANTGLLYLSTDVASGTLYRSNGSSWVKVARGASENSLTASYLITTDGTTITGRSATGAVISTSTTDAAAVLTALLPAANSSGAEIIFGDGNFPWSSVPALPKGITGKLRIRGSGATKLVAQSVAGGRGFDFNRTADYDTFQNIEITDIVFDRASIATTQAHVLLGNLVGGAWSRRINFANIVVRRCKTINVPVGGASATHSISLVPGHLASSEGTQNTVTNILIEDCDFGGDYGIDIMGSTASGGTYTAGLGVNVFLDNIIINRCSHDSGVVPVDGSHPGGNQIGGVGFVGVVRVSNFVSKNAGDCGLEIDSAQDSVVTGCVFVDAYQVKALSRNFRAPIDAGTQKNIWRDCWFSNVAVARSSTVPAIDVAQSGGAATAGYDFGELAIIDCHSSDTVSTKPGTIGHNFSCSSSGAGSKFRRLTIREWSISWTAINDNTSPQQNPVFVDIRSANTSAVFDIDGLDFKFAGSMTGTGGNQMRMLKIAGANARVFIKRYTSDTNGLSIAGSTTATFYWIGLGLDYTSSLAVSIDGVAFTSGQAQGSQQVIYLASTNLTLIGQAVIRGLDTANITSASGFDVNFTDAAHKTGTVIERIISQRSGSGSGPKTAPTAMTGLVTGTGLEVGLTIPGIPVFAQFVQGSGSAITAIDISTNVGTTYTNLLTQASAAMPAGSDLWIGPLRPDARIMATFAGGTQPTINLVPARL
jgi:hypothetical protein